MGMFDSIYLTIKCPYCGQKSDIECQTKELNCTLETYWEGENIGTDQFNYLDCIADCQSKECVEWRDKNIGYHSGFGRTFDVRIYLNNGFVTGNYTILSEGDRR